jgi:hypothetical protein
MGAVPATARTTRGTGRAPELTQCRAACSRPLTGASTSSRARTRRATTSGAGACTLGQRDDTLVGALGPQGAGNATWYYKSTDALATIDGSGYFNAEVRKLKVGDIIFADGNNVAGMARVVSNNGSVVDVSNFAGQTTINSD